MLKKLQISNFKGWKNTGQIDMAPITLFFGANSSGKSSIGQFLMMLKQTIESPDRKSVFYPGGLNSAAQLGSYRDMVFGRNMQNQIKFEYQWSLPRQLNIETPKPDSQVFPGNVLQFAGEVELSKVPVAVASIKYTLIDNGNKSFSIELKKKNGKNEYALKEEPDFLVRHQGRGWPIKNVVRFYGFPDEVTSYYQNADFVQDLNLEQEKLFASISYLGSLRERAARLYPWSGNAPDSVGYLGGNAVSAMLASRNRQISFGYRQRVKTFKEVIAYQLKKMGLIEDFNVKAISTRRQEYEVKVSTQGSGELVDLPDVGVGVSQVLPVLVQCFYSSPNSIIIMEQPEIHLHPRAQAALADVMIDAINAREDGENRNIQLIIETHSEHFLRRLQRRIAEGKHITQDQVAAYFANTNKTPATLEKLQLDQYGNIRNWPDAFFGDEMGDITAQAEAAINRKISENQ